MSIELVLEGVAARLKSGEVVPPVTTRKFIGWADAQRRSYWNVHAIRRALDATGLRTDPDFESAYIDAEIEILLAQDPSSDDPDLASVIPPVEPTESGIEAKILADPTYRISKLEAANKLLVSVKPDNTLAHAVTLMMAHDFSQLPVMTSDYTVKGMVSWHSIGVRMVFGKTGTLVHDVMDDAHEIAESSSMFQAISIIDKNGYVLVRDALNKVSGIVTSSDLSQQFQQLAEPFLLLGEIENQIRHIIGTSFSASEMFEVRDASDGDRKIQGVADLTFGEYVHLIQKPERWSKLKLSLDRNVFCQLLDNVRKIRNDVMHFDPDGVPKENLNELRNFSSFLQNLQAIKNQ